MIKKEYIERETTIKTIQKDPWIGAQGKEYALSDIAEQPAADVVEVRHGKWMPTNIPSYFGGMIYKCSLCGANDRVHTSIFGTYCWKCGAKMDGGNDVKYE